VRPIHDALSHVRRLADGGVPDAELLQRYAAGDEVSSKSAYRRRTGATSRFNSTSDS
jgi:hypothetical protein